MRFAKSKIFQEALIIKFTTSVWSFQGALKTTEGEAEVPSLDKEGWLRPLSKCREASLAGADGVVGSSHRLSEVERTTPAAPPKGTGPFYLMARPPLLCQGGDFAFPCGCPRRPCPADDLWLMISLGICFAVPAIHSHLLSPFFPEFLADTRNTLYTCAKISGTRGGMHHATVGMSARIVCGACRHVLWSDRGSKRPGNHQRCHGCRIAGSKRQCEEF